MHGTGNSGAQSVNGGAKTGASESDASVSKLAARRTPVATIFDVASAAGVHPASVSRALRGTGNKVSAQTRARIERIAAELGYRPNLAAGALRTGRASLVAVVLPDAGNPVFAPILQSLEEALRQRGLLCVVTHTPADAAGRRSLVTHLANHQVAGLVVLAAERRDPLLDTAHRLGLPTVLVNRGHGDRRFPSVVNDDDASVQLVLAHLHGLGHRDVAHVAGPASSSTGRVRRAAFERVAAALKMRARVVEAEAFTREAGRLAAVRLLGWRVPTAVFGANDLIALGVLDVARERRLRVPDDFSLVGHNDMPLVDLVAPALTTVRLNADEMGRRAAALLLAGLAGGQMRGSTVLPPELVVRDSTSPPRGEVQLRGR